MNKINTIVLAGGGIKGGAYIGCFKALFEHIDRKQITNYIGCSIGGIISILLCIGYTIDELEVIFMKYNFSKFIPEFSIDTFICDKGISNGDDVLMFFNELLSMKLTKNTETNKFILEKHNDKNSCNKIDITFKDLFDLTNIKVTIVITNYLTQTAEYWNYEDNPDYKIIDAMIATSRVPIFFTPYKCNKSVYLDGGIMNNFPINRVPIDKVDECIGISLIDKKDIKSISDLLHFDDKYDKIINYIISIFILSFDSKYDIIDANYKKRILNIENNIQNFMDFSLNHEDRIKMVKDAYAATNNFIALTFPSDK